MYKLDVLIQGFPGRAICHGGLGWSTITLLRGEGRVVLVDVGAFGVRKPLLKQLTAAGVEPDDVTDVLLTHAHYDHAVNFTLFPRATIWIGDDELSWAVSQPPGFNPLPELYVRELASSPRVRRIGDDEEFLPGFKAYKAAGHTPGHLLFYLAAAQKPVLFTGDAAKNRAELLSMDVHDTADRELSIDSLKRIWELWRAVPGTLLVPGHDLTMRLDAEKGVNYLGERKAGIAAWFSESLANAETIDLCGAGAAGLFTSKIPPK